MVHVSQGVFAPSWKGGFRRLPDALSLGPDDFPALSLDPDDFLTLSFGPDDLRVCTIKGTKFLSVMMSLPALLDVFSAHHLLAVIAPLLCSRSPLGPTS